MKKWFKASLWVTSLVVVLGIGAGAVGWFMLRGTPKWYKPDTTTEAQRLQSAKQVEDKLNRLSGQLGKRYAREYRQEHSDPSLPQNQKLQGHKADEPVTIEFTDDELNAFFNKWVEFQNRRAIFDRYVETPRIIMQKDGIILAGKVKELDLIVSMQFQPKIDADGRLRMDLVQVLGGVLPLSDSMWSKQRLGIENMLSKKLPEFQRKAAISDEGFANGSLGSASMNEMILATLRRGTSDAVVFVPNGIEQLAPTVPVKITSVKVSDHTLTLTAETLTPDQRQDLLKDIKDFDPESKTPALNTPAQ